MKKEKEVTYILNITTFISFLCQIFSEHLLCTKHCIRGPDTEINQVKIPALEVTTVSLRIIKLNVITLGETLGHHSKES